ncbi:transcriptional regulator [Streptomyces sp. NPDC046821]|uniref:transcriptional regulator n=1 Tax=Streptomyces sp. NPDC046821 TaxID=3154702 RepID=UPI0033C5E137
MAYPARDLLERAAVSVTPGPDANRLVPLIASGAASTSSVAAIALAQRHVIPADERSFRHLAGRAAAEEPECVPFFTSLAEGEGLAYEHLGPLLAACGVGPEEAAAYEPLPGCQAYPSYVAWLALNAAPGDTVVALTANFAAWGGYCATLAESLHTHYGFPDEACAFFDLFATPSPTLEKQALAGVQAAADAGCLTDTPLHHARLLQTYEQMFWDTLTP